MTNDKVVNNSYELLKSKYSNSFENDAKKDIEELVRNDTKMINHLKNKKVKKIIHVEGRLVNFDL